MTHGYEMFGVSVSFSLELFMPFFFLIYRYLLETTPKRYAFLDAIYYTIKECHNNYYVILISVQINRRNQ